MIIQFYKQGEAASDGESLAASYGATGGHTSAPISIPSSHLPDSAVVRGGPFYSDERDPVPPLGERSNALQLLIDIVAVGIELLFIVIACAAVVGAAVILMLVSF